MLRRRMEPTGATRSVCYHYRARNGPRPVDRNRLRKLATTNTGQVTQIPRITESSVLRVGAGRSMTESVLPVLQAFLRLDLRSLGFGTRPEHGVDFTPPLPESPPTQRRGRPPIHNWQTIERLDAEFCRTYLANNNRAPIWKERHTALRNKLGKTTPHIETLKTKLR
jgi:hypothetical protein